MATFGHQALANPTSVEQESDGPKISSAETLDNETADLPSDQTTEAEDITTMPIEDFTIEEERHLSGRVLMPVQVIVSPCAKGFKFDRSGVCQKKF